MSTIRPPNNFYFTNYKSLERLKNPKMPSLSSLNPLKNSKLFKKDALYCFYTNNKNNTETYYKPNIFYGKSHKNYDSYFNIKPCRYEHSN